TSNPPTTVVSSNQAAASYTPSLANSTTYFWQIVARNSAGTTTGAVWSFTTASGGGGGSTPFTGTPFPIPGRIEAESFDNGGQDIAYHDDDPESTRRNSRKVEGSYAVRAANEEADYPGGGSGRGQCL